MIIAKQGIRVFNFSMATNSVNLSKNYYKILEVDHSCDQKVIKKSYLKLVKTLHPDVNPNGKEKFTEVQQAYEVLSDDGLKKYYDQNNYCKNGGASQAQTKGSQGYSYSTQAGSSQAGYTKKASSGHEYYTHRTYKSENPRDYFYNDNEPPKNEQKTDKKNKTSSYEHQSQDQPYHRNPYPNKQAKYAHSKQSWQFYQEQKQQKQQQAYQNETPEQRQLRDKLKAMRGFTSPYNVMWARHHLRPDDLMTGDRKKEKEEQVRRMVPERVRKFYDKVMDKLEELAMKDN